MGDFLVTLPSNSNMASHPKNGPADYTVQLATPISLDGDWEAALVSVQYTHNWVNTDQYLFIRFVLHEYEANRQDYKENSDEIIDSDGQRVREGVTFYARHDNPFQNVQKPTNLAKTKVTYIIPQHFPSPQALGDAVVHAFQIAFPNTTAKLHYFYNHARRRGRFVISNGDVAILSTTTILGDLLGHSSNPVPCGTCTSGLRENGSAADIITALLAQRTATQQPPKGSNDFPDTRHWYKIDRLGTRNPKLKSVSSLWVYSDITENQLVGNYKVPLLGVIPVTNIETAAAGTRTHYCVNPVHFLGVRKSYIDTITIKLANERGETVPFATGAGDETNVVCCIRFRRRKSELPI